MQFVRLGSTGLKVSRICLGMMTYGTPQWRPWVLDSARSRPLVQRAVELGINFFDTADMYSAGESEVLTGQFVREFCKRDEVVVASKVFFPVGKGGGPNTQGLSRKRILHAVDESLRRLKMDYIDLYQIHRFDYETSIEETLEALDDVVKAGKVRYLGASSMWAWQFARAQQVAKKNGWSRFVSMQNHYNLAYREEEREMIPLCKDLGVALIPWSPLARGFLAGNRSRTDLQAKGDEAGGATATSRALTDNYAQEYYYRDSDFQVVENLSALAAEKGVSNATLAYAWLLHKGVTAPIVGASKLPQLEQAVAAVSVQLSAEDLVRLESAYQPHPVTGHE